jgi:hypothetical protein
MAGSQTDISNLESMVEAGMINRTIDTRAAAAGRL